MKFQNYIRYKHGSLHRGEPCLWRNKRCVYMGSYRNDENSRWIHMLQCEESFVYKGLVYIEESILQCIDKNEIVCHQQQTKIVEGQMQLC